MTTIRGILQPVGREEKGIRRMSYMVMFMILITHIRKKSHAKENIWMTIVADNPFGKASSEHVIIGCFRIILVASESD